MNQFCFVGICAGLAMLMLMIMPSSIADYELEINVEGEKEAIVYVKKTDTVLKVKEKIVENLKENINEEIDIIKEKLSEANAKETEIINEEIEIINETLKKNNYENSEILTARITLRLNENDSPLEDDEIMKDCGTVKDTVPKTIYLTWDELEIKVEGDKNAIVYVKETDTVLKVKEKIVEQLKKDNLFMKKKLKETKSKGKNKSIHKQNAKLEEKNYENSEIVPARITLRLNENGSPLEDDEIMKDCGTVKDTVPKTIYLTWDEFKIYVEGDKKATVYINETDKVLKVKEKIVKQLKKIIETELSKANAKETEIITVIKEKLFGKNKRIDELMEEKNKILTTRKILRLDKNGSPFEDGKTISEYVKNGAIVFLELEGYEILVEYKGKTYTIWVNKEDTVYELKEKIQKVIQIRHSEQKLLFPYYNIVSDHKKTMQFYNIGKNDSLLLKRQFKIGCHYKRKDYFPIVEETEKVSSVKEKVKEMINKEINEENEKVKKEINDEKKVKEKIQEKSGIQLKNITLKYKYREEELKDDREIGSYDGIDSTMVQVSGLEQTSDD
ncbi:hypothetical protein niasHS_018014 [Heterodera schachtii]|uniref:Ubiquitin-like domain-containing protein n=1 Tax=Heterodera schachtii TaxID=97005 RepID=A0ABD2HP76_HETSC